MPLPFLVPTAASFSLMIAKEIAGTSLAALVVGVALSFTGKKNTTKNNALENQPDNSENKTRQEHFEHLMKQNKALQETSTQAMKEVTERQHQLNEVHDALRTAASSVKEDSATLATASKTITGASRSFSELSEEIRLMNLELNGIQKKFKEVSDQLTAERANKKELSLKLKSFHKKEAKQEGELKKLADVLSRQTKKNNITNTERELLKKQNQELSKKLQERRTQILYCKSELSKSEDQSILLKNQKEALEAVINSLNKKLDLMQEVVDSQQVRNQYLENELEKEKLKREELDKLLLQETVTTAQWMSAFSELEEKYNELIKENKMQKETLTSLVNKTELLLQQNSIFKQSLKNLRVPQANVADFSPSNSPSL